MSGISTKIIICSASDGRVRLTTKGGVRFDARVLRFEYAVRKVVLVEPLGFTVAFGDFVPDVVRIAANMLVDAERSEGPTLAPDVDKLRKAIEWPGELAPKSTAAARKRAEQALAAAATPAEAAAAVTLAIESGATQGLAAAVARLDGETRARLTLVATEAGADAVLAVLLADAVGLDLGWLLARAVAKGRLSSVAALLAAGADVDGAAALEPGSQYSAGVPRPPLHHAVEHGHRSVVRRLLAAGARVTDSAALAWAAIAAPDPGIWTLLLAAGLDVDARDHRGDPLLLALGQNRQFTMLAAAIAAGADVNATYPDGSTLLLHAIALAFTKGPSTWFIQDLLRAGADVDAGRLGGRNPLALARVVPHDPGADHGERWIAGWLESAGAVAVEDDGAAVIAPELPPEPPPLPPWQARIDDQLTRAPHYEVLGVRFTPRPDQSTREMKAVPALPWSGLGSDTIAVVRAKHEHLIGRPHDIGDEYKITFEYGWTATVDGVSLKLHVCDWKAREIAVSVENHPDAALCERVAAAFWEMLTRSPLAAFSDRFRYDDRRGHAYHSDGRTAFAEFGR